MGDKIEVKDVQVIQGGLLQIDAYCEEKNEHYRIFANPDKFFTLLGQSMFKNFEEHMISLGFEKE